MTVKETRMKHQVTKRVKTVCIDCRTQSSFAKDDSCYKCGGTNIFSVGIAYKIPKKNDVKEWNLLMKLSKKLMVSDIYGKLLHGFAPHRFRRKVDYRKKYDKTPILNRKQKNAVHIELITEIYRRTNND